MALHSPDRYLARWVACYGNLLGTEQWGCVNLPSASAVALDFARVGFSAGYALQPYAPNAAVDGMDWGATLPPHRIGSVSFLDPMVGLWSVLDPCGRDRAEFGSR